MRLKVRSRKLERFRCFHNDFIDTVFGRRKLWRHLYEMLIEVEQLMQMNVATGVQWTKFSEGKDKIVRVYRRKTGENRKCCHKTSLWIFSGMSNCKWTRRRVPQKSISGQRALEKPKETPNPFFQSQNLNSKTEIV